MTRNLFVCLALALCPHFPSSALAQTNASPTAAELAERVLQRRAVEAIWGMPAVNYDLMLQETLNKTSAKVNEVVYWGRPQSMSIF